MSEYKNEAFRAFEEMMVGMRSEVCTGLFRSSTNLAAFENMLSSLSGVAKTTGPETGNAGFGGFGGAQGGSSTVQNESSAPQIATPVVRDTPKVGRNDPCPCGSGKKYKKCCGAGIAV